MPTAALLEVMRTEICLPRSAAVSVYFAFVAPTMATPLRSHWYVTTIGTGPVMVFPTPRICVHVVEAPSRMSDGWTGGRRAVERGAAEELGRQAWSAR